MKKNKGITLIALVITIIVLLILAGVTINAIMGNESAMEKAKQAKTENDKGNELDLIKLAVTDAMVKSNDGQIKLNDLNESLNGLITANATGNSPWTVTGNTGIEYVITNTGLVEVETVKIGDTVNYSTSLNGITLDEWSVFYVDGNYTYIILNDYLPNSAVNITDVSKDSENYGDYVVWSDSRANLINAMTNPSNWSSLLTGTLNGTAIDYSSSQDTNIKAMGSPTIDLYVNSWNKKYPSNMIYTAYSENVHNSGYDGYYVGDSENPTTTYVVKSISDSLYYPHDKEYAGCKGYWLASPSAYHGSMLLNVYYFRYVRTDEYRFTHCAFRPVICLPSSIFE